MGAFEDAVKKKEDELKAKKASAEERLNYPDFLEQSNPTYRLAQDLPIKSEPVVYKRSGPNAEMREAMRDAVKKKEDEAMSKKAAALRAVKEIGSSARIVAMKEEERAKAMKKYADMKEK